MPGMTAVASVGGCSAGLSAALSAKNNHSTDVFDTNEIWLHKAHVVNYSSIERRDSSPILVESEQ